MPEVVELKGGTMLNNVLQTFNQIVRKSYSGYTIGIEGQVERSNKSVFATLEIIHDPDDLERLIVTRTASFSAEGGSGWLEEQVEFISLKLVYPPAGNHFLRLLPKPLIMAYFKPNLNSEICEEVRITKITFP